MSKVTKSASLNGKQNQTDIKIEIQDLMQAANEWQENFLNPCQDALYDLLQKCYATYKKIKGKKNCIQALDLILTNKGVKVQSNSSLQESCSV